MSTNVYLFVFMNSIVSISLLKKLDHLLSKRLKAHRASLPSRIIELLDERPGLTAQDLCRICEVDKGYLSRTLRKLIEDGLVKDTISEDDGRMKYLTLTRKGSAFAKEMNGTKAIETQELIEGLRPYERSRFNSALSQVYRFLTMENKPSLEEITIRTILEPGDLGFIIQAHAELYHHEYSYGPRFERYVIQGVDEFVAKYDSTRSRVWMCEHHRSRIGFICLMDRGKEAQLRFFFILPEYRGLGLGNKMVRHFLEFIKEVGYSSCYLLTTNDQIEAANLYRKYGFELVGEEPLRSFGDGLIEQRYSLKL